MTGRQFTEEHKTNMRKSNARRGKPGTFRNRTHSIESKQKIADRPYPTDGNHAEAKAIIVNGVFYASMNTAERALGVSANVLRYYAKQIALGKPLKSRKHTWITSVQYVENVDHFANPLN